MRPRRAPHGLASCMRAISDARAKAARDAQIRCAPLCGRPYARSGNVSSNASTDSMRCVGLDAALGYRRSRPSPARRPPLVPRRKSRRPSRSAAGAPPQAELKFDWPVRGRIVYGCGIEDKERITIGAGNGAEVRAAQSGVVAFAGELKRLRQCRSDKARRRLRLSVLRRYRRPSCEKARFRPDRPGDRHDARAGRRDGRAELRAAARQRVDRPAPVDENGGAAVR